MPQATYAQLAPTGDAVTYDDALVFYPDAGAASTFGPILTPRVHARFMDTLELASGGKIAMSLRDQHALDIDLDPGAREVRAVARDGNSLRLESASNVALQAAGALRAAAGTSAELASGEAAVSLAAGEGATLAVGAAEALTFKVGGAVVASAAYDPARDRPVFQFPAIATESGLDSERLTRKVTYLAAAPHTGAHDGADNDSSGIRVVGAPAGIGDNPAYFQKSFLWHTPDLAPGGNSMRRLGSDAGYDSESFWDLRGGALRMTHVNQSSGDEISYVFRVNGLDELELVRRVYDRSTGGETFQPVHRFGQKRRDVVEGTLVGANRGTFTLTDIAVPGDLGSVAVTAGVFSAYTAYDAFFGVYEQLDDVAPGDLFAAGDAGDPSVVKLPAVEPGAVTSARLTFSALAGGAAFSANRVYVIASAIREIGPGALASTRAARAAFFMSATDEQFFAQAARQVEGAGGDGGGGDGASALSVVSPKDLVLELNSQSARAAIINTTEALTAFYYADADADAALHPGGKTPATLLAWLTASYPSFVNLVHAAETGFKEPEAGVDAEDLRYWHHLDAVQRGAVVGYAVPAAHTVGALHAAGHAGAVDSYGRPAGFLVVEGGAARYAPETPSEAAGWTVLPGGADPRTSGGVLIDQPAHWSAILEFVKATDVFNLPLEWEPQP